jgi:hypothetical protein
MVVAIVDGIPAGTSSMWITWFGDSDGQAALFELERTGGHHLPHPVPIWAVRERDEEAFGIGKPTAGDRWAVPDLLPTWCTTAHGGSTRASGRITGVREDSVHPDRPFGAPQWPS